MELRDYIRIINRRKGIVIIVCIIIFAIYIFYLLQQPQFYSANSTIMIRIPTVQERVYTSQYGSPVWSAILPIETQILMMQQAAIIEKVINEIKKIYKISVKEDEVVNTTISQVGNTNVVRITTKNEDKDKCIAIVNAYAEVAVNENIKAHRREFIATKKFVKTLLERYNKRLREAEEKLRSFNEQHNVIDLDETLSDSLSKLSDYQREIESIIIEQQSIDMIINQLKDKLNEQPEYKRIVKYYLNPEIENLKNKLIDYHMQLFELTQNYTDTHPKVKALLRRIDRTEQILHEKMEPKNQFIEAPEIVTNPLYVHFASELTERELQKITLGIRKTVLERIAKLEEQKFDKLSKEQLNYTRLVREIDIARSILSDFTNHYERLRVQEAGEIGNAQVLSLAKQAYLVSKIESYSLLFMLLIAAVIGIAFAVVTELLDTTIRTAHHIKRYLNLPLLGSIPKLKDNILLIKVGLKTPLQEIYNKIAFRLESICFEKGMNAILFTSSHTKEGKTTILLNLGISLARLGEKVLLVDTDLRRASLHRLLELDNTIGLTNILTGELEVEVKLKEKEEELEPLKILNMAIKETATPGLYCLTSGRGVPNPVELLRSERMKELIKQLKRYATFVLFDSPPLIAVIDATVLASQLDGVCLVIDSTVTKRREAILSKTMLATHSKVNILGCILNNIAVEEEEYYYHYYYYPRERRSKRR